MMCSLKKCYIVNVSWGNNKKFSKVFKTRYDAEAFFNHVQEEIQESYPNYSIRKSKLHNKRWYFSPVGNEGVFVSLTPQEFVSSDLAISEYNNYMSSESED